MSYSNCAFVGGKNPMQTRTSARSAVRTSITRPGKYLQASTAKVGKRSAETAVGAQMTSTGTNELVYQQERISTSPNGKSPLGPLSSELSLDGPSPLLIAEEALSHGPILEEIPTDFCFDTIESAIEEIAAGQFVIVLDDECRENEGDLVAAAELVTSESIAFMVEHTSGIVCAGMMGDDLDRLQLPLMVPPSQNTDAKCTAFTVTVDLKDGTTTGISASDRAKTLSALADSKKHSSDFRRPGHIFPLRYAEGGVLTRRGHTEASVDLARLAGCRPAGVLCEIVNRADGSMARMPQLFKFARQHHLKIITIDDLVHYLQSRPSSA